MALFIDVTPEYASMSGVSSVNYQVAQRFAYVLSPTNRIEINGALLPLNSGLNLSVNSGIIESERS